MQFIRSRFLHFLVLLGPSLVCFVLLAVCPTSAADKHDVHDAQVEAGIRVARLAGSAGAVVGDVQKTPTVTPTATVKPTRTPAAGKPLSTPAIGGSGMVADNRNVVTFTVGAAAWATPQRRAARDPYATRRRRV